MDEFSPSPSGAHCLSAEFTVGSNKLSCRKLQVNMYIYIYIHGQESRRVADGYNRWNRP